jgi:hypothetical protein
MEPDAPERPRSEPEIIPPNDASARDPWGRSRNGRVWTSFNGAQRVYVARVGPLAMAMAAISVGLLAAFGFLVLVGVLAIIVPLGGVILAALIIAAVLRGPRR